MSPETAKMSVDYPVVGPLEWMVILMRFVIIYFRISMLTPTYINWEVKNIKILTWDMMPTSFDVLTERLNFWCFYLTRCDYSLRLSWIIQLKTWESIWSNRLGIDRRIWACCMRSPQVCLVGSPDEPSVTVRQSILIVSSSIVLIWRWLPDTLRMQCSFQSLFWWIVNYIIHFSFGKEYGENVVFLR